MTQVRKYLHKKFGRFRIWNWIKKHLAHKIIAKFSNLMVRPMLLSYIDSLITDKESSYDYVFQIYQVLINKWILREARRYPEKRKEEFGADLFQFSKDVAMDMCFTYRGKHGAYVLNPEDLPELKAKYKISLTKIEMTGRSLLNLNSKGQLKFAHKSIMEYFLAVSAYRNRDMSRKDIEKHFAGMDFAWNLFYEMIESKVKDKFIFKRIDSHVGSRNVVSKVSKGASLADTDLRFMLFCDDLVFMKYLYQSFISIEMWNRGHVTGANLAGINLAGANLAGAHMNEVNLTKANLEGASLAEVNLFHANLMYANLLHADLTGACLERANLYRACLANANLAGANLNHAEMIDVELTGANLAGADLEGTELEGRNA